MSYTLDQQRTPNQSSRTSRGYSSTPKGITVHHWGADGQEHDNVVHWLTSPDNGQSSAHDVISGGRVTVLADATQRTWHSGNARGNGETIGLECRPEMSEDDWDTLVQRCADHEERFGSLKYWKHKDWKNTACPGRYADRIGELVDDINAEHVRRKAGGETRPRVPKDPPREAPERGEVPGPGHEFPLPAGSYFGPAGGPDHSVSGHYGRSFHGRPDYWWLKEFARQLARRGWSVGEGKTYLSRYGNDGRWGPEFEALVRAFQREQGLAQDGRLGPLTWREAFEGPVT